MPTPSRAGILTTASNLLFSGDGEGNLLALDRVQANRSGGIRWVRPARHLASDPCSTVASTCRPSGTTLTAWALPESPTAR